MNIIIIIIIIITIIINYFATKLEFTKLSTAWREMDHMIRC
jgi:hypothetical protein